MAKERELRPLSSYLKFGVRLHWEDIAQLTAGALLVYLPISLLVLFIHPSVQTIVKHTEGMGALLPQMLFSQLLLRVLQAFVLIIVILRVDARRKLGENVWDVSEAFACIKRVALVDLVYVFGLQILGIVVFWVAILVAGLLLGENPMVFPVAFMIAAVVVIGPAIRYYFASYVSLFHGTPLLESFRRAALICTGGERLVASLVMTFLLVWFAVWQVAQGMFGGGTLGQIIVQAGVMTTSIPYFIASYLIFFDLAPPEADGAPTGEGQIPGVIDPFESDPLESEPGEEKPEEKFPPTE